MALRESKQVLELYTNVLVFSTEAHVVYVSIPDGECEMKEEEFAV